jgi:segregation and condensation protein A
MQEDLYDLLVKKDEITWQTLIKDLIKSEQLDPWNVDLSTLTNKYLETLKTLQEANFHVSGKVILAAALLLRIKSNKLVEEDISNFDALLYPPEDEQMDLDLLYDDAPDRDIEKPKLTIKTPQPRKRKVNLYDLMGALQKALEVNHRRILRRKEEGRTDVKIPEKKVDVSALIKDVYDKIKGYFSINSQGKLTFHQLIDSEDKEAKIFTFVPLLHLDNQKQIEINQEEHFGDIHIKLLDKDLELNKKEEEIL